jgi:hypothetical protein
MIDLCEDCGARLEMDAEGVFFCPIQRRDTEAWRTDWAEQVRHNAEDKP